MSELKNPPRVEGNPVLKAIDAYFQNPDAVKMAEGTINMQQRIAGEQAFREAPVNCLKLQEGNTYEIDRLVGVFNLSPENLIKAISEQCEIELISDKKKENPDKKPVYIKIKKHKQDVNIIIQDVRNKILEILNTAETRVSKRQLIKQLKEVFPQAKPSKNFGRQNPIDLAIANLQLADMIYVSNTNVTLKKQREILLYETHWRLLKLINRENIYYIPLKKLTKPVLQALTELEKLGFARNTLKGKIDTGNVAYIITPAGKEWLRTPK